MRIGLISSGTRIDRIPPVFGGGIQKYIWNLGRELVKLGHEVHIIVRQQPGQLSDEVLEGIFIHRIAGYKKFNLVTTLLFGLNSLVRILKLQKKIGKFDVLHAQSRVSGLINRLVFRQTPFLFTAHNWDIALTSPRDVIPIIPYAVTLFIEKRIYTKTDKIIALTEPFQQLLIKRYKTAAVKTVVIPNMVNIEDFKLVKPVMDKQLKELLTKKFIIFIGRLEKEKGTIELLRIFKQISKRDKNLNLIIIGDGNLRAKLISLRNEFNLRERVFILGKLHEIQVNNALRLAKLLILLSDYEIMPTVILEAWAVDCPVLLSNYYGVTSLIKSGYNGYLINKKSLDKSGELIQRIIDDEKARQVLIENSRKNLISHHLASIVAEQINKVYRSVISK